MKTSEVSSEGLTLTMSRDDEGGPPNVYVWEQYTIQKMTLKGWKQIKDSEYITSQFLNGSGMQVKDKFSYTWELKWEEECGKLPIGVYRIAKEVGRVTETQPHYAPFLIISWWQMLLIILIVLAIAFGIWVGVRFGVPKKVKIAGGMILACFAIMLGIYQGMIFYYNHQTGKEILEGLDSWNVKSVRFVEGRKKILIFTEDEKKEFFDSLATCEIGEVVTEEMIGGRLTYVVVERYIGTDVKVTSHRTTISVNNGIISELYTCEKGEALDSFIAHYE